jgi:hypothetical protein
MVVMRHWQAVVLMLLMGASAGCFGGATERTSRLDARPAFTGPTGDDVLFMDVTLIEKPIGDRYLNGGLWADADEQAINLDQKKVLDDNGFRVCQLGGLLPPGELQDLLTARRSCIDPHRIALRSDHPTPLPLGPPCKPCRFRLQRDGGAVPVDFEEGQCVLEVVASLADDNHIRLRFTPHVKHGRPGTTFGARRDPSGVLRWHRQEEQPEEVYPWLSWELSVAEPVQHVLVLRTGRSRPHAAPADGTLSRSAPLALRAGWTSARGSSE